MEVHTTTPMKRRNRVYSSYEYDLALSDMIDILTDLKGDRRRYNIIINYQGVNIGPAKELTRMQALKYLLDSKERYPDLKVIMEEAKKESEKT